MICVDLTLIDIRRLKMEAEEILRSLPDELRKKALRYHREDDQLRSIGSSFLLLKAAKGKPIHYSAEGKPFVEGENFFNISHSGDYVVLAEAKFPVGVDIERIDDIGINNDLLNIALTEREKLWVKDSLLRFYVVWTRKESLIKCEGSGFMSEPCEIDTLPENDLDESVLYKGKYYRADSFMINGHIVSVAVKNDEDMSVSGSFISVVNLHGNTLCKSRRISNDTEVIKVISRVKLSESLFELKLTSPLVESDINRAETFIRSDKMI